MHNAFFTGQIPSKEMSLEIKLNIATFPYVSSPFPG